MGCLSVLVLLSLSQNETLISLFELPSLHRFCQWLQADFKWHISIKYIDSKVLALSPWPWWVSIYKLKILLCKSNWLTVMGWAGNMVNSHLSQLAWTCLQKNMGCCQKQGCQIIHAWRKWLACGLWHASLSCYFAPGSQGFWSSNLLLVSK